MHTWMKRAFADVSVWLLAICWSCRFGFMCSTDFKSIFSSILKMLGVTVTSFMILFSPPWNDESYWQPHGQLFIWALSCRYFIVSPSGKGTQVAWWINKHVPSSVTVEDKTSSYSVLALMGPKSREILQTVTRTSLSNSSFPYSTAQVYCMFLL